LFSSLSVNLINRKKEWAVKSRPFFATVRNRIEATRAKITLTAQFQDPILFGSQFGQVQSKYRYKGWKGTSHSQKAGVARKLPQLQLTATRLMYVTALSPTSALEQFHDGERLFF
jgi:hypothetical protein